MRLAIRIVLGGLVLVFAFTTLYVAAFHAPGPHDLRLGTVGPPRDGLRAFGTTAAARRALLATDVDAVLDGDRILVAGALGAAPAEAAAGALERLAPAARVTDLRPLPARDARGLTGLFTVVGVLIPSLAFGIALALFGGAPLRALLLFAAGAGLLAAFDACVVVGALDGPFLALAAVCALFALAVAAAGHGLVRRLGAPGAGLAAVLVLVLGLSSSGGAVTYRFEPGFFRAVSQYLPPGAALTAIRNVAYFDGAATLAPLLVLGAWAVAGLAASSTRKEPA